MGSGQRRGLEKTVAASSGGIAPINKVNHQLIAALKERGMDTSLRRPQPISDEELTSADLILAADIPTALTLSLRLRRLGSSCEAPEQVILFTSLDPLRFKGQDNLPDPYHDPISPAES